MGRAPASSDSATADLAPLCVPVELSLATGASDGGPGRFYRLGFGIGLDRLRLRSAVPDELVGPPLRVRLNLPPPTPQAEGLGEAWSGELALHAVAAEVVVDEGSERERAEPRLLLFRNVSPTQRARLESYVSLRMLSPE